MPELPEVETIRRQLEPLLLGVALVDAWAFPSGKFSPALEAVGTRITSVGRRGKYLLIGLDRDGSAEELIVHLGMTGRLSVDPTAGLNCAGYGSSVAVTASFGFAAAARVLAGILPA